MASEKTIADITQFLKASRTKHVPEGTPTPFQEPQLPSSFSFYDHHLGAASQLKAIVNKPNLSVELASLVTEYLKKDITDALPPTTKGFGFPDETARQRERRTDVYSGQATCDVYSFEVRKLCSAIAGTLHYAGNLTKWGESFSRVKVNKSKGYPFLVDQWGVSLRDNDQLSSELQLAIHRAQAHTPAAGVFLFLEDSPAAETILRGLGGLESATVDQLSTRCSTLGFIQPDPTNYGDLWNSSVVQRLTASPEPDEEAKTPTQAEFERKTPIQPPIHRKKHRGWKVASRFPSITLPATTGHPHANTIPSEDLPLVLIRHAWAQAVASNSSFIVFHCGSFERIGIRDRDGHTLYLSGLIDINDQHQEPGYYKIQTGLYLAFLRDITERAPQDVGASNESILPPANSRPKTRAREAMVNEVVKRDVLLLSFDYQGKSSVAPASFTRWKSKACNRSSSTTYTPSEYFTVTLTSDIARGNTGHVHAGTLRVVMGNKVVQEAEVVVKISFSPDQIRRLQKEMLIYENLMKSISEGIPWVYGLFEDVDSNASAMVMDRTGECLLTLFPDAYSEPTGKVVSENLGQRFHQLLNKIHDAGYLHRDIRPENLCLNNAGDVFFIDFDRARKINDATADQQRATEHESLDGVLAGGAMAMLSPSSSQIQRDLERDRLFFKREANGDDIDSHA